MSARNDVSIDLEYVHVHRHSRKLSYEHGRHRGKMAEPQDTNRHPPACRKHQESGLLPAGEEETIF